LMLKKSFSATKTKQKGVKRRTISPTNKQEGTGMKRLATLIAVASAFCFVAAGCNNKTGTSDAEAYQPVQGGTFRLSQSSPKILDPNFVNSVYESSVINQLFNGLVRFDFNLNVVPDIAESWTISEGGLQYEFTLKRGVKFHNGREVTSRDFIYSISRIMKPPKGFASLAAEYLKYIKGAEDFAAGKARSIEGLEAVGPYKLRVTLEKPYASFLAALAMDDVKVVPREEVESKGVGYYTRHPVGTGPFKFDHWEPDVEILLLANEDYFEGRPFLDSLLFIIPKTYLSDTAVDMFHQRELEIVGVPSRRMSEFTGNPTCRLMKRQQLFLSFIGVNTELPPFDNQLVRKGFAMAIDRERIRALAKDVLITPTGILPPGLPGYAPEEKLYAYNPKKAAELLKEAARSGAKLESDYWSTTPGPTGKKLNAILKENLEAVGFKLNLRYADWLELSKRIDNGEAPCFAIGWQADLPDPDTFLYSLFKSDAPHNMFKYKNPVIDKLLDEARDRKSLLERWRMQRQAEKIIVKDAPIIPLFHAISTFAVQSYVKGVEITPFGLSNVRLNKVYLSRKTDRSKTS